MCLRRQVRLGTMNLLILCKVTQVTHVFVDQVDLDCLRGEHWKILLDAGFVLLERALSDRVNFVKCFILSQTECDSNGVTCHLQLRISAESVDFRRIAR